jgi:hypothetical protein
MVTITTCRPQEIPILPWGFRRQGTWARLFWMREIPVMRSKMEHRRQSIHCGEADRLVTKQKAQHPRRTSRLVKIDRFTASICPPFSLWPTLPSSLLTWLSSTQEKYTSWAFPWSLLLEPFWMELHPSGHPSLMLLVGGDLLRQHRDQASPTRIVGGLPDRPQPGHQQFRFILHRTTAQNHYCAHHRRRA